MPDLKGSKTQDNLKEAFAGESQANRRYLYFAQKADVEGYPDVAALFRSVAEGETGHAFGHFDFLAEVGDPVTDVPVGPTDANLPSAQRLDHNAQHFARLKEKKKKQKKKNNKQTFEALS
jgi:rubrerythrin